MLLRRPRCTTTAIAAGTASKQHYNVTFDRLLADNVFGRNRSNNGTNLHAFCHVSLIVNFGDMTGSKSDLVSIGTVAMRCKCCYFTLWQLARKGVLNSAAWIS